MKGNTSLVIIVVGLLVLWLGVTGKFDCFGGTLTCMLGAGAKGVEGVTGGAAGQVGAGRAGSALDRVTARLGAMDETLSLEYWLRGGTPPFAG